MTTSNLCINPTNRSYGGSKMPKIMQVQMEELRLRYLHVYMHRAAATLLCKKCAHVSMCL